MRFLISAIAAVLAITSCWDPVGDGSPCTADIVPGIRVSITGPDSAVAKVVDGAYVDSVMVKRAAQSFSMRADLAHERTGTYTLTVRSPDYLTQTFADVIVSRDECHVLTRLFSVFLQRERLPG